MEGDEVAMDVVATMIGATGNYTISALAERDKTGVVVCMARAFDHPDPAISLPSGTTAKHTVWARGPSLAEATHALEDALAMQLGSLDWVRWNISDNPSAHET